MDEPSYAWRYQAKCKGEDTDTFYPPRDKDLYTVIADRAKTFCFGENGKTPCPVRTQCLWDAVERDEPHGIWGGLSHRERNAQVRKWKKSYKKQMTLKEFILRLENE
jgi:WhiB family redox-sensing transcriptional regulator